MGLHLLSCISLITYVLLGSKNVHLLPLRVCLLLYHQTKVVSQFPHHARILAPHQPPPCKETQRGWSDGSLGKTQHQLYLEQGRCCGVSW